MDVHRLAGLTHAEHGRSRDERNDPPRGCTCS
jgi:hypothetical protein